jgi:hypothetical protein
MLAVFLRGSAIVVVARRRSVMSSGGSMFTRAQGSLSEWIAIKRHATGKTANATAIVPLAQSSCSDFRRNSNINITFLRKSKLKLCAFQTSLHNYIG